MGLAAVSDVSPTDEAPDGREESTIRVHLTSRELTMTENVSTDKLIEDLQLVIRDAEALLQATAGQAGDRLHELRQRAQASLAQARTRLAEAERAAVREIKAAAAGADEFVHDNPWQAVGIAAGLGLLLGLLIGRR